MYINHRGHLISKGLHGNIIADLAPIKNPTLSVKFDNEEEMKEVMNKIDKAAKERWKKFIEEHKDEYPFNKSKEAQIKYLKMLHGIKEGE